MRGLRGVAVVMIVAAWAPAVAHAGLDRIAFTGGKGIYTIRADGSGRHHLLGSVGDEPTWSPAGRHIAFSRSLGGEYGQQQIWTMRANGTQRRALTPSPPEHIADIAPAWSPDGRRVAFIRELLSEDHPVTWLMTVGADGRGERTVVTLPGPQSHFPARPAWSPDGTQLLYTRWQRQRVHVVPSLWIVGADGSGDHMVADRVGYGSWSPQGGRIAAVSTRAKNGEICGEGECYWTGEIYVMNADGSRQRRLTRSKADDAWPVWSPDGARIAFASDRNYRGGSSEIYSVRPDGSCLTWLTNGSSPSSQPVWQPGAARSSSARGCGALGRAPLVETKVPKPHLPGGATSWWLGTISPGGLLLTDTRYGYSYDDCGSFNPATCPESVDVIDSWVCSEFALDVSLLQASQVSLVRGALFLDGYPEDVESTVFTGTTQVALDTFQRRARQVVGELRPARSEQPMPGNLPPPVLPNSAWRELSPEVTDKLHALGVTGSVRCPPRRHHHAR